MSSTPEPVAGQGPTLTVLDRPWQSLSPFVATRRAGAARAEAFLAHLWVLPALDVICAVAAVIVACAMRYAWKIGGLHGAIAPIDAPALALIGLVMVLSMVADLARAGAYRRSLGAGGPDSYLKIARAATLAIGVAIVASLALQEQSVSRILYLYAWVLVILFVSAGRLGRATLLARSYQQGHGVRRVLVVGATPAGKMVMQNVAARLRRGYRVIGYVGEHAGTPLTFGRFSRLGTLADIDRVLEEHSVDEIVVALPSASHKRVADVFAHCGQRGIDIKFVPDLFDLRLSRVRVDGVAGIPIIDVRVEKPDAVRVALKRALDVAVAGAALVVAAPIMLATALLIRLESEGPILFRQERLGKDGVPFTIFKFRSMRVDAERQLALLRAQNEASGPIFKMRRDPRVTRVGRVIRKLSIDELPQLLNVLRGDMSLVGPRPPLASEVAQYEGWHRRRLEATPGITCLWGVSGRSALDFDEMVMLDLYYIDNWSLGLDLRILVRTAITLLRPTGAY